MFFLADEWDISVTTGADGRDVSFVHSGVRMDESDRSSVTRRDFLKTAGLGSLAGAVAGGVDADAQSTAQGPTVLGPGAVPVSLTVNGMRLDLNIEPRVTLLDALRTRADLTGNKRVCDRGSCGACTMIVDGRAVYACSTLAIDVQGRQVRTVDGLAANGQLHPVQQAFCDVDALMCGFCTPGFVMATVALLEKHPSATPEQMRRGLDGNICRCGTFVRVMEAAVKAKAVARA
jgi:xanthine dehydrogenase YagT iron-sulfur-binding subunit